MPVFHAATLRTRNPPWVRSERDPNLVSLANLVDAEELLSLIGALAVGWPLRHDRVLLRSEDAQLASTSLQNRTDS
jgi:hypothetical protein